MSSNHHTPTLPLPAPERTPVPILVDPAANLPELAKAVAAARLHMRWSASSRQLVLEVRP